MTTNDILKYFTAEKNESLVFVVVGIVAILIACYGMFSVKTEFYKGLFYPLVAIAVIQVVVGGTVYLRAPKDITRVTQQLNTEPGKLETEELPRMAKVNEKFTLYRYIEIALLIVGVLCIYSFKRDNFWFGLGIGLTIQSLLMLGADFLAERRATEYTELLKAFIGK
jgi:hypothetical protein